MLYQNYVSKNETMCEMLSIEVRKGRCPCDFCAILKMEPELLSLDSDEFKRRALALQDIPHGIRDGISRSDMLFLNITLGIVPEGMEVDMFLNILKLQHFTYHGIEARPVVPIVQESWNGNQVVDWLISGRMVSERRRSILLEKLDGKSFREGRVQGVLSYDEILTVNASIWEKAIRLAEYVRKIATRPGARAHSSICRLFNIDPKNVGSYKEIEQMIIEKYDLSFRLPLPNQTAEQKMNSNCKIT
jgi:hypothetical protein